MQGDEERRAIITLDKLNTVGRIDVDRDELRAAVRVAKATLGKRIPLKARLLCPSCRTLVAFADDYCRRCGQALDWDQFI